MKRKKVKELKPGIYRIFWKDGGSSLAAVGVCENDNRWLAPINWISPTMIERDWRRVKSVLCLLPGSRQFDPLDPDELNKTKADMLQKIRTRDPDEHTILREHNKEIAAIEKLVRTQKELDGVEKERNLVIVLLSELCRNESVCSYCEVEDDLGHTSTCPLGAAKDYFDKLQAPASTVSKSFAGNVSKLLDKEKCGQAVLPINDPLNRLFRTCTRPKGHDGECMGDPPKEKCGQFVVKSADADYACTRPLGHEGECSCILEESKF